MVSFGEILVFLIIGALAGWLAGKLVRGRGYGLIVNMLVGILGALLGGLLFGQIGWEAPGGFWGRLLVAVVGAVVLLFVAGLVGRLTGR